MTLRLQYPDPPLRAPAFVLRPWAETDAEDVVLACTDPDTQRFIAAMPRPYTLRHAQQFIAGADESLRSGRAIGLAVSSQEDGRAIGSITLHCQSAWHWYVGYWLTPASRRKGITSAALRLLSAWAFEQHPDLERISLKRRWIRVVRRGVAGARLPGRRTAHRIGHRASGDPRHEDQTVTSM